MFINILDIFCDIGTTQDNKIIYNLFQDYENTKDLLHVFDFHITKQRNGTDGDGSYEL